ncbi:MAG: DUF4124 domain-containing protein [Pseudomonadota bacterium]
MMKKIALLLFTALLAQPALALYKWVDEDGNVHYSDRMPPDQVTDQHSEIDESGAELRRVDRARTQEEIEAERSAAEAEAERKAEEKARAEAQARKDRILLDTFTTLRDIELLREDRLSAIESNIKLTQTYNEQIADKMARTEQKIERIEKAGNPVPDNLRKQLERSQRQLRENEAYIARQIKDRKALNEQFDRDVARFRELKDLPPEAAEEAAEEAKEEIEEQMESGEELVPAPADGQPVPAGE